MKPKRRAAQSLRDYFKFTPAQARGIVLLLPLIAVAAVIIALANRPRFEKSFLELADQAALSPYDRDNTVGYGAAGTGVSGDEAGRDDIGSGSRMGKMSFGGAGDNGATDRSEAGYEGKSSAGYYANSVNAFTNSSVSSSGSPSNSSGAYHVNVVGFSTNSPGSSRSSSGFSSNSTGAYHANAISPHTNSSGGRSSDISRGKVSLFPFDPNTATLQEFCRLGLEPRVAASIIKYRERGKRFEIAEDFATCWGVTLDDYTRLEPYIRIAERFRAAPFASSTSASSATSATTASFGAASASSSSSNGSRAQTGTLVSSGSDKSGERNNTTGRGFSTYAEPLQTVELNTADSATLRSVRGIGEVLVGRIMEYRRSLGGFVSTGQLGEIKGMSAENLELIIKQIRVDSCEIRKIDINFAPHKTLVEEFGKHPYVTDEMLRKLLKYRQLKGGWRTIGDMIGQNIMTDVQAARLEPYLLFRSE